MRNAKRKQTFDSDIISDGLKKKFKTTYTDIDDSNALILPSAPQIEKKSKKESKTSMKLLSKKERKALEKITKTKDEKSKIKEMFEELEKFSHLSEKDAITSLVNDLKTADPKNRKTISTKVKPISKRKYKQWENRNTLQSQIKPKSDSPDTSDFSSDEEIEEEVVDTHAEKATMSKNEENNVEMVERSIIDEKPAQTKTEIETPSLPIIKALKSMPKMFVTVDRPKEVQEARLQLPILGEEATIMEALEDNDIIIVSGATGCGKTTQLPQFLYEAGFTQNGYQIGVTEPRRIAAISVSERVKYELSCKRADMVAYNVRFQNTSTCFTQIKFMTDGILLQELNSDILLKSYSAIIIDEAHERSVYTDVLIGLLSIVVRARRRSYEKSDEPSTSHSRPPRPLKLIIMSATLRVADFADNKRLFPGERRPPVIQLDARQYPVQVTFSKHTRPNYLEEAFKMIYKVHNESIEGGILVFVTGQQDCLTLCKWLKKAFPVTQKFLNNMEKEPTVALSANKIKSINKTNENKGTELIKVNLADFSIIPIDEECELNVDNQSPEEQNDCEDAYESDGEDGNISINDIMSGMYNNSSCMNPVYSLPLYSLLDREHQDLVFKPPPPGQRLVVIATNVAETSLTIPNIKFVIDTGMEKVKKWDKITGMSKFQLERISKSSAEQRKGRAGRMGPGLCFRLYSSAVFEEMKSFSLPEILQRPVEDIVLLLKHYIHSSIAIHEFCLPTVPSEIAIERAEKMLISIGALRGVKRGLKDLSEITEIGKSMTQIPLSPRFAKMLLLSNQHNLLPYAILMASLLSVPDFFTNNATSLTQDDTESNIIHINFKRDSIKKKADLMLGDITILLASFCKLEYVCIRSEEEAKRTADICGVRWKAFVEVKKLRQQLTDILMANVKNLDLSISVLPQPTKIQFEHLRQLILSGSSNNVAVIAPPNITSGKTVKSRRMERGMYLACNIDRPVYIHTHSVLCKEKFKWVVFQELYENATYNNNDGVSKPFMRNLTVIEPEWLTLFCTLNCRVEGLYLDNKESNEMKPYYDGNHDRIMALAKRMFYGDRNLELPSGIRVPVIYEILENKETQIDLLRRWFARFLLEGLVFKKLESWKLKMKSICKPELLLSPFANSRLEIMNLMSDINQLDFPSKKSIAEKWKINPNYMLDSYLNWIKPDERDPIIADWPPIDI